MSVEAPHGFSEPQEILPYSNVQIQLVGVSHVARNDREYAEKRRTFVDLGEKFFRRGFNNIFFIEDANGAVDSYLDTINSVGRERRSFRLAYWMRSSTEDAAQKQVKHFESRTVENFILRGNARDLCIDNAYNEAFLYSQFDALDTLQRKGHDIVVRAEKPTHARRRMIELVDRMESIDNVSELRDLAALANEEDVGFAEQIVDIMQKNPTRTRLMVVLGSAHMPVVNLLPRELQDNARVVDLYPQGSQGLMGLLNDIHEMQLSDSEIMAREKEIIESLLEQ